MHLDEYICVHLRRARLGGLLPVFILILQLPEDVQARMLADAEALEQRHRQRVKDLKRQKFIKAKKTLYSKLKFYGMHHCDGCQRCSGCAT